jgi:hypothetical protein
MVDPQLLQVALARAITDSMSKEDQHVVLEADEIVRVAREELKRIDAELARVDS